MSYLYSKLPETGVSPHIGTGGIEVFTQPDNPRPTATISTLQNFNIPAPRQRVASIIALGEVVTT